jgi:hypothetical protein
VLGVVENVRGLAWTIARRAYVLNIDCSGEGSDVGPMTFYDSMTGSTNTATEM